jgi:hypothetical protein
MSCPTSKLQSGQRVVSRHSHQRSKESRRPEREPSLARSIAYCIAGVEFVPTAIALHSRCEPGTACAPLWLSNHCGEIPQFFRTLCDFPPAAGTNIEWFLMKRWNSQLRRVFVLGLFPRGPLRVRLRRASSRCNSGIGPLQCGAWR